MVCAPVRSIIPSLKLGDYLSVQAHKPCSISHLERPLPILERPLPDIRTSPPYIRTSSPYIRTSPPYIRTSSPYIRTSPPYIRTSSSIGGPQEKLYRIFMAMVNKVASEKVHYSQPYFEKQRKNVT